MIWGAFPDSLVGKESTCNAGDPGSVPGLGRSAGEGVGYPLQYSWASLVTQLVKNLPVMWKTWVRSLGWEDPWRRERLSTPVSWPGEFHGLYSPWGHKEWTQLSNFHLHFLHGRQSIQTFHSPLNLLPPFSLEWVCLALLHQPDSVCPFRPTFNLFTLPCGPGG